MRTWRTTVAELLRQWRVAREERRRTSQTSRDQRAADELERAKVNPFPHNGGGG